MAVCFSPTSTSTPCPAPARAPGTRSRIAPMVRLSPPPGAWIPGTSRAAIRAIFSPAPSAEDGWLPAACLVRDGGYPEVRTSWTPADLLLLDTDGCGERTPSSDHLAHPLEGTGRALCPPGQRAGPSVHRLRRTHSLAVSAR
jgi:hypothetical protein